MDKKDDVIKNKVFVNTFNGPFLNSDYLVIEYEDVLQAPELIFLANLISSKPESVSLLFNMDNLYESISQMPELIYWYINRPNKEVFTNIEPTELGFKIMESTFKSEDMTESFKNFSNYFVDSCICDTYNSILENADLNFMKTLYSIYHTEMIKKVIIFSKYSPNLCSLISRYLTKTIQKELTVISCTDLGSLLKSKGITNNSTFVFSDITYINTLKEVGLLDRSSILISEPYQYNYNGDEYKVNIDELQKEYLFKINFFDNYNE